MEQPESSLKYANWAMTFPYRPSIKMQLLVSAYKALRDLALANLPTHLMSLSPLLIISSDLGFL